MLYVLILPGVAARSLQGIMTTGMSMKLRWTSMSKFLGYFDFSMAKEWRLFMMYSATLCNRLREMDQALAGCSRGSIPEEESAARTYEDSYIFLNNFVTGSEQATWWGSS